MKKIVLAVLFIPALFFLSSCGKAKSVSEQTVESISSSEEIVTKDADPSEYEGKPKDVLLPKLDKEAIGDFDEYDKLSDDQKNQLLYDYLIVVFTGLGGGKEGAKELLGEMGVNQSNVNLLSQQFSKVREEHSNEEFTKVLNLFVENIMSELKQEEL